MVFRCGCLGPEIGTTSRQSPRDYHISRIFAGSIAGTGGPARSSSNPNRSALTQSESALPPPAALSSRGLAVQKAKWEEALSRSQRDEAVDTYVEGESEEEIEGEDEEVEVEEVDEDNDSIEDVQLGEESPEETGSDMNGISEEVDEDEDGEMNGDSSEVGSQDSEDED